MSLKSQSPGLLEVTGNLMELPPAREVNKSLDRKPNPLDSPKKRSSSLLTSSTPPTLKIANRVSSLQTPPKRLDSLSKSSDNSFKEQIKQLEVISFFLVL